MPGCEWPGRGITEQQVYTALNREQRRTPGEPGTVWIHGLVPEDDEYREARTLKEGYSQTQMKLNELTTCGAPK